MPRIPQYRKHARGHAFLQHKSVPTKDHRLYLGKHGSPESIERYQAFLGKLAGVDSDERDDDSDTDTQSPNYEETTINVVVKAYLIDAKKHYKRGDEVSYEYYLMKQAIKPLVAKYGSTLAKCFGPKRLKRVRRILIRRGLSRKNINHMVSRIKRVFRWASEEELIPPGRYHALRYVRGLYKGQENCRESEDIKPAPIASITALLCHLSPTVAAMVRVQFYCGMRPGEVCILRACDLDTSGDVWLYRPERHKTEWRGCQQVKAIPPIAQQIIKQFMRPDRDAYLFSPADSAAWCLEQRMANRLPRKTKRYPCEIRRVQKKARTSRRRTAKKVPGDRYCTSSYYRALTYAFERAEKKGVTIDRFAPNQLRHSIGTLVSQVLGQQQSQVYLGHESMDATNIYTERTIGELVAIAAQMNERMAV